MRVQGRKAERGPQRSLLFYSSSNIWFGHHLLPTHGRRPLCPTWTASPGSCATELASAGVFAPPTHGLGLCHGSLGVQLVTSFPTQTCDVRAHLPWPCAPRRPTRSPNLVGAAKMLEPESATTCPSMVTQGALCKLSEPEDTFQVQREEHKFSWLSSWWGVQAGSGRPSLRVSPSLSWELPAAWGSAM